jgi:hypothetical protein
MDVRPDAPGPRKAVEERRGSVDRRVTAKRRERWLPRIAFYSHLWLGVLFTVVLLVIAITGIVLNHKRGLGLMPEVSHEITGDFGGSLAMGDLAMRALTAAGVERSFENIDRMDVRPRTGIIKVRLRDAATTEVTLDVITGDVLHVGERGDVFMEKLHSGEIFGDRWVLLSDAGAIALIILLITGYWLWLKPRWPR